MNQHNNPPFALNQKVVALRSAQNDSGQRIIKDEIYTISDITRCVCGEWNVTLLEHQYASGLCTCAECNAIMLISTKLKPFLTSEWFAPIITKRDHTNVAIEQSIKDMPIVEERSDVKKKEVAV